MNFSTRHLVLNKTLNSEQKTWNELFPSSLVETVSNPASSRSEFISQCKSGKLDNVVAAYRTFGSVNETGLFDSELVEALPSSLKFLGHNGAGYDQLYVPALTEKEIIACNVPTAVDDATADTAVFLLLGALRNFNTSMVTLRRGKWRGEPAAALGHDPGEKMLGILGMGGIGRNLAKKCRALGMKIQYHNRRRLDTQQEDGATYVSFDELLATSDVLSVHVPLNEHTRHMISKREFAKCKRGIIIVNTARGAVIDEAALVDALESGQVASAGLDVYEEEPKVHEGLRKSDHCILLPHMGTWTVETQAAMERWCMRNVRLAIDGIIQGADDEAKRRDFWGKMSVVPEQNELLEKTIKQGHEM